MECEKMRQSVQNFSFNDCTHGSQGYNRLLLQLFGLTGHGKSSFINSCKYVVDNADYRIYAKVAPAQDRPETMMRSSYELTRSITLVDNRGCVMMNKDETGVIYAQLGNFLPLNTEVTWRSEFENILRIVLNSDRENCSVDFIVPVFVYSAETRISNQDFENLKEIVTKASDITGLVPTVVLTHELSEHLPDAKEKFRQMGVTNMFSLENYTDKPHLKTRGKHEAILRCLYGIVEDVMFRMSETRKPVTENIRRKEILIKFIHDRDKKKAEEAAREEERKILDEKLAGQPFAYFFSRKKL
ncbi:uncharacterized protein [Hyperolius riggenbachi]|uniref:uncharacterized protein n=1 Tax=Hyperolius riggenbachi TaxID=752182 RepID=UPI0035A2C555